MPDRSWTTSPRPLSLPARAWRLASVLAAAKAAAQRRAPKAPARTEPRRRWLRTTAPGRAKRCGASLFRGALLEPVLEPAVEIRVDRQVVGEQLRVDLLELRGTLVLLPVIDA